MCSDKSEDSIFAAINAPGSLEIKQKFSRKIMLSEISVIAKSLRETHLFWYGKRI